jgi:hypothetical protein
MSSGARTLRKAEFGFTDAVIGWSAGVADQDGGRLVAESSCPEKWIHPHEGVTNYLTTEAEGYVTGFPVDSISGNQVQVARFTPPKLERFDMPAVQYICE